MSTVLVVEDEFGIAELFDAILSDEGYRVLTAINGKHALEMLAKERADLVFTDFMMPVLDGAGLLRAMADDPALRGIPVVLMSALPEKTVAERCSGYVTFMRKPFKVGNVIETAARFLARPDGTGA
jgi:CheY-like chemotaxis protein